ncbi:MAG: ATP-binding cassette domain-containing protein [Spartobacteria bacterium]|nr:ATP-binding cassette domain-containing protein [Spartobacteria bacterium]
MALAGLQNISMAYGGPLLLDNVTLQIEDNERICLLGRNGEGKSTLLRIIAREINPSDGALSFRKGLRIGYMMQQVPARQPGAVAEIVGQGLPNAQPEWDRQRPVATLLSQMELDPHAEFDGLSGGQKRRALLARALVHKPDLLILDEPTNHLDIPTIQWLENFLLRWSGSLLFVTHDRVFLKNLATRIIELDRGKLINWNCSYNKYLERKQVLLEAEEQRNAVFDKKLAKEETWIRKGIKARRTRNEGRVRALKTMREERRSRREQSGAVTMRLQTAERSGMKVITAKHLSYTWNHAPLIENLSMKVMRGDKIGLIGPNGCGKTTLLNILLGNLPPQQGHVEHGTRLDISYFDQHREQLDDAQSVADNIDEGNNMITVNGHKRHVISYLEDFLFPPERSRSPVSALSGGERNRLLLARLFARPSNVLVLDEPTNDLDAETLELLEDLLVEYTGTLLLVSHDREFLNNVVSSTLVFEGNGRVSEFVGGYDDWLSQRKPVEPPAPSAQKTRPPVAPAPAIRKLTNREREELNALPGRIEQLENELQALQALMADPAFYKQPPDEIRRRTQRAELIPHELEAAYARWEELDGHKA